MAKGIRDENEDEAPVEERKRRRPRKPPVGDDDDDDGGRPGRGRPAPADEGEEEENSLSTGNVFLDIILDFRDDCYYWAKDHFIPALIIGIVGILLTIATVGFTIRYIIKYINRPTLKTALSAYDFGSYGEARRLAEEVLRYTPETDPVTRAGTLFVLGAAACSTAEIAWDSNRQPYYLAAAGYLKEAEEYGFVSGRQEEGYFLLGKSLYMSGELVKCRRPLETAMELGSPNTKLIHWYLANAYFLDAQPNLTESLRYLRAFQREPTLLEEESYESYLLEAMIFVQLNDVVAAEKAFLKVPLFERFQTMRHFVSGQIAFIRGRKLNQLAQELEGRRDPISLGTVLVAPDALPQEPQKSLENEDEPIIFENEEKRLELFPPGNSSNNGNTGNTEEQGPSEPSPVGIPSTPFDNPNSERLLPGTPRLPETTVWPVYPTAPTPIGWPEPEDENTSKDAPLYRRIIGIQQRAQSPYADQVDPTGQTQTEKNGTNSISTNSTSPKPFDPDAIIVLPPGKRDSDSAPMPGDLPESITTPKDLLPINIEEARKLRERAGTELRQALEHFKEVRRRETFVPRWLRAAELLEGLTYEELGELAKAQETYIHLTDSYPGTSEAAAADFLFGEIERRLGRMETALSAYARAFEVIRHEPNYASPWLPKETILARSEEVVRTNVLLRDYKPALTMLRILHGVMQESPTVLLRAEIYETWGNDIQRQTATMLGDAGEELGKEARERFRQAGEAFSEFARLEYTDPNYATYLWRSAENYRQGRDYRHAILGYRNFLRSELRAHRPEIFLYLAEMYIHLDAFDPAIDVLLEALQDYPKHALVPRTRLMLSLAYYEKKEWDKAKELLRMNLIGEYSPASAIYRDSMYALGKIYYERGELLEAIPFLEDAVKIHPNAIQAADAHYCLAQAYLKRSDETLKTVEEVALDDVQAQIREATVADRLNALEHIRQTEELLAKRQNAIGLTESERLMLRNTLFGAGAILMSLQRYNEAIPTFDIAATRYQDKPEAMDALMQIAVAYRHLNRPEDALTALNRAEVVLNYLEKSATIPKENNWASLIQVQKNLIAMGENE